MSNDLQIAIGVMGFAAVVLAPLVINRVLKFKIEIEKMRNQTEIRKEEIRAKNQLDIENLMLSGNRKKAENADRMYSDEEADTLQQRSSDKLRY
jgi:beta-lactamase regulating signal transducer with metallopeptidase domain